MPGLAIGVGHRHVLVAADAHRLGRDILAIDDERHAILTGQDIRAVVAAAPEATAPTRPTRPTCPTCHNERLVPQIPIDAIDAGSARRSHVGAGDLTHLRAGRVANPQRDIGLRFRQVEANRRAVGRVLTEERLVSDEPAIVGLVELHGAPHVEQERVGLHRLGLLLQRRRIIEDPDAAAMRGDNHVVVTRVEHDLVDRHRRQIRLDAQPLAAAIGADEQAELRSRIEHARVLRILRHRRDGMALRQALAD